MTTTRRSGRRRRRGSDSPPPPPPPRPTCAGATGRETASGHRSDRRGPGPLSATTGPLSGQTETDRARGKRPAGAGLRHPPGTLLDAPGTTETPDARPPVLAAAGWCRACRGRDAATPRRRITASAPSSPRLTTALFAVWSGGGWATPVSHDAVGRGVLEHAIGHVALRQKRRVSANPRSDVVLGFGRAHTHSVALAESPRIWQATSWVTRACRRAGRRAVDSEPDA
jgi:hypothetical protein